MKILLVEDDHFKQELILREVDYSTNDAEVEVANSVQQAVAKLRSNTFDFVILDMSLPSHSMKPGGAQPISQPSGGIEVLLEIAYEERSERIVILTQYPEIEFDGKLHALAKVKREVDRKITVDLVDVVYFDATAVNWKNSLRSALQCQV